MTMLRLTDAGRAALADATNRAVNNVQLRSFAIGSGTGPGGEMDDSRAALRSQQNRADLTGTTLVSGRLAVRAEFAPTSVFAVTEAGILARIGDAGAEFLLAYWAVADVADALATTISGVTLIVAGVLDVTHAAAEVDVTVSADITFGGPGTLVALTDAPDQFDADKYFRANNAGTAGIWDEAPPVVATEAALPALAAAVQSTYLVRDYDGTGRPVLALKAGGAWWYAHVPENFPLATTARAGVVELETSLETVAGIGTTRATTGAGVAAAIAALVDAAPTELNTLNELAAALADDPNFAATINAALALRPRIEVGTRMVFYQAAAPAGWTKVTTLNDRVLRVVSGDGGSTGGSWELSGLTVGGTMLTVAQMPLHRHNTGSLVANAAGEHRHTSPWLSEGLASSPGSENTGRTSGPDRYTSYEGGHQHSIGGQMGHTGGDEEHDHSLSSDGTWRPAYADVIICQRD